MKSVLAGLGALCVWATAVLPVSAGWDNVFQPTLFFRRQPTTTNYYAPPVVVQSSPIVAYSAPVVAYSAPACDPCQQQKCDDPNEPFFHALKPPS